MNTTTPTKLAIAIDLDQLRDLMAKFLDEMLNKGHVTVFGPDSLTDWKFETFLQWAKKRRETKSD